MCNKIYIGENSWLIKRWICEHILDFKLDYFRYVFVKGIKQRFIFLKILKR